MQTASMSACAASMMVMGAKRPKVPSELRRRVLIEAGHRCAIPTCRSTPVEIAHIVPWATVRKHEFKNLIALCPTCHTRFDDPHGPIDRKAMKQYKANLNHLLSTTLISTTDQIALISAYQEFRFRFSAWVASSLEYSKAKSKKASHAELIKKLDLESTGKFAWALGAAMDFQSAWKEIPEASELAGSIFYHVCQWSDELRDGPQPLPQRIMQRDISEEISEAAADLHSLICEKIGI